MAPGNRSLYHPFLIQPQHLLPTMGRRLYAPIPPLEVHAFWLAQSRAVFFPKHARPSELLINTSGVVPHCTFWTARLFLVSDCLDCSTETTAHPPRPMHRLRIQPHRQHLRHMPRMRRKDNPVQVASVFCPHEAKSGQLRSEITPQRQMAMILIFRDG